MAHILSMIRKAASQKLNMLKVLKTVWLASNVRREKKDVRKECEFL